MTPVRSVCSGCGVGGLPLLLTTALHFAAPEMTSEGQSLGRKSRGRYRTHLPCSPLLFPAHFGSSLWLVCATLPQKKRKYLRLVNPVCVCTLWAADPRPVESVSKAAKESQMEDAPFQTLLKAINPVCERAIQRPACD